ncbi:hypothetical protein [Lysobacter capsici]|uniref:hypothetical protein n=1 Tax=Lysobacter capsici TaxID=435897 RepID=UPI00128DD9A7|nr:hypothetical protein [Lysobacter capsici]
MFDARATTARCLDRNDSSGGIAVFFASVALVEAGGASPCRRRGVVVAGSADANRSGAAERKTEVRAPAMARDRFAGYRSTRSHSHNSMAAEAKDDGDR